MYNQINPNTLNASNAITQQQQMQQYILTEFLKTPEGRKANEDFANAQRTWWENMNNPQPQQAQNTYQGNEEIKDLKNQVEQLTHLVTGLVTDLGGKNE